MGDLLKGGRGVFFRRRGGGIFLRRGRGVFFRRGGSSQGGWFSWGGDLLKGGRGVFFGEV